GRSEPVDVQPSSIESYGPVWRVSRRLLSVRLRWHAKEPDQTPSRIKQHTCHPRYCRRRVITRPPSASANRSQVIGTLAVPESNYGRLSAGQLVPTPG